VANLLGRGSLPAPLTCSDCKREPCGACRQVSRAKYHARRYGYRGDHFIGAERLALVAAGVACGVE